MRGLVVALLVSFSVAGCKLEDDGIVGRYEVNWSRTEACGETGILASPTKMRTTIAIREAETDTLQWIERGETHTLLSDGEGTYTSTIFQVVDMRAGIEGAEDLPPCAVERLDTLVARPAESESGEFESFDADLTFEYAAAAGSQCGDLMSGEGFSGGLPCTIAYEGFGARVVE